MRTWAMGAAGLCLLVMSASGGVNLAAAAGVSQAPIVLAQNEPKKPETVKQKIKRVWRNMTGYKFDVGCPIVLPVSHSICTETGKDREVARAKCQSRNSLCSVVDRK
ncbi:MAG TPA: hypothetical protein VFC45_13190 [Pseudolabrys sp.]|nr:hypothetical protein [Pseudolabrys sp.]